MTIRRKESTGLPDKASDLAHGQIVIVTARWILVLSGLLFILWDPDPIGTLRIQILFIMILAVANFYLHAQALMRRPVRPAVIYAASVADLVVITTLIVVEGGFESNIFVFYVPAIVAFSVAFSLSLTILYTGSICGIYAILSLVSGSFTIGLEGLQVLFSRLVVLVAVAVVGSMYAHTERERRRAAEAAGRELMAEIGKRRTPNEHKPDLMPSVHERS